MKQPDRDFLDKLAKVLGMLGSAHDGEVVAAARRAEAMVRGARLTWRDVIISTPSPVVVIENDAEVSDSEMLAACLEAEERAIFNPRESEFVISIASQLRRRRRLSEKQRDWLASLYERASRSAAA